MEGINKNKEQKDDALTAAYMLGRYDGRKEAEARTLTWAHELPKVTGTFFVRDIRYKEEAGLVHISSQQAARLLDKGPSPFIQYAGPISPPIEI